MTIPSISATRCDKQLYITFRECAKQQKNIQPKLKQVHTPWVNFSRYPRIGANKLILSQTITFWGILILGSSIISSIGIQLTAVVFNANQQVLAKSAMASSDYNEPSLQPMNCPSPHSLQPMKMQVLVLQWMWGPLPGPYKIFLKLSLGQLAWSTLEASSKQCCRKASLG